MKKQILIEFDRDTDIIKQEKFLLSISNMKNNCISSYYGYHNEKKESFSLHFIPFVKLKSKWKLVQRVR